LRMKPRKTSRGWGSSRFAILRNAGAKLWWCAHCNVPLLSNKCGICKRPGRLVRMTPPADARPALGWELLHLRQVLREEGYWGLFPSRRIVLLNKIPYPDAADEVVVDGYVVGHLYYDIQLSRWRFKPLYAGVHEIVERQAGYYAKVNVGRLSRNFVVHRGHIIEASLPPRGKEAAFIALRSASGEEGLGLLMKNGRIRVLKSWKPQKPLWGARNPSWIEAVRANEAHLAIKEQEAIRFIRETVDSYALPPVVSFSGGKDSLVVYHLVKKAVGKKPILFNDTGIEHQLTVEYVHAHAAREAAQLLIASPKVSFWSALEKMGPPARDYRWCCKVLKLAPIAEVFKQHYDAGALSFVGQRRLESASRALSPRIYRNRWMPRVVVAAPINTWTQLEVWLYIFREKLTPNPLYFMGFDRIGCWLCPALELGEAQRLRERWPELWSKWENWLEAYKARRRMPDAWTTHGLWRWLIPPGDMRRVLKADLKDCKYLLDRGPNISVYSSENRLYLGIGDGDLGSVAERIAASMASVSNILEKSGSKVTGEQFSIQLSTVDGKTIVAVTFENSDKRIEDLVLKAIIRALLCVKCGSCEVWCESGAIDVDRGYPAVDSAKCIRCHACIEACPVAEYTLKRLRLLQAL